MAGMEGTGGYDPDEDFYEDDEPLEKIVSSFEHGVHGVTARPVKVELTTTYFSTPAPLTRAWPAQVSCEAATPEPIVVHAAKA